MFSDMVSANKTLKKNSTKGIFVHGVHKHA